MKTLNEMFREVIVQNELEGDLAAAYKFSKCSAGNSGWSFGISQFDVKNNSTARECLLKCGFTQAEVASIQMETVDPRFWNSRLDHSIIDGYDNNQLDYCLNQAENFFLTNGIAVVNPSGIIGLADYTNQYGLPGSGSAAYYKSLDHPVTNDDVLQFKLGHTEYGKDYPKDCVRRHNNIAALLSEVQ